MDGKNTKQDFKSLINLKNKLNRCLLLHDLCIAFHLNKTPSFTCGKINIENPKIKTDVTVVFIKPLFFIDTN